MAQHDFNLALSSAPKLTMEGETPGRHLDRRHSPIDEFLPDDA